MQEVDETWRSEFSSIFNCLIFFHICFHVRCQWVPDYESATVYWAKRHVADIHCGSLPQRRWRCFEGSVSYICLRRVLIPVVISSLFRVLHDHIKRLAEIITPGHKYCNIPAVYHGESPWPSAQSELSMINAYKVSLEEMNVVFLALIIEPHHFRPRGTSCSAWRGPVRSSWTCWNCRRGTLELRQLTTSLRFSFSFWWRLIPLRCCPPLSMLMLSMGNVSPVSTPTGGCSSVPQLSSLRRVTTVPKGWGIPRVSILFCVVTDTLGIRIIEVGLVTRFRNLFVDESFTLCFALLYLTRCLTVTPSFD